MEPLLDDADLDLEPSMPLMENLAFEAIEAAQSEEPLEKPATAQEPEQARLEVRVQETAEVVAGSDSVRNVLEEAQAKPCLYYFNFAGRAELIRLSAAVGGLELEEIELRPDEPDNPCLEHGEERIEDCGEIEKYIASIAPAFAVLTPEERSID